MAHAQNGWTETAYVYAKHDHLIGYLKIFNWPGGSYSWSDQATNTFVVAGDDGAAGMPWRLEFANKCDDSWVTSQSFSASDPDGTEIDDYEDCCNEMGQPNGQASTEPGAGPAYETFQQDGTNTKHTRTLMSHIVNEIDDYPVVPQTTLPAEGGN